MKAGFSNLGEMLISQNKQSIARESSSDEDSENSDVSDSDSHEKKRRQDGGSKSILQKLEENYKALDQEGPEIHSSLGNIVTNMIKEKLDDEKVNELRKRYPKPKNCELLAETTVNLPIWNNLSEKARVPDIKLQRSQKSLVKGVTVNDITDTNKIISNTNRDNNKYKKDRKGQEIMEDMTITGKTGASAKIIPGQKTSSAPSTRRKGQRKRIERSSTS